eukprot:350371-Chlamydomonas_euryale.AAC.11
MLRVLLHTFSHPNRFNPPNTPPHQEHSLLAAARRGLLLADADVRDDVAVLELPHQRDLCKEALNVLRVPQDLWLEAFDRDNLHGAARQRLVLALVHDCKRALTCGRA